jgi:hypothetical protein
MDPALLNLIITGVSGAAGGNIIGQVLRSASLGTAGNSVAGIAGGLLASFIPGVGPIVASLAGPLIGSAVSGGVGGGVLTAIIGIIRSMMQK